MQKVTVLDGEWTVANKGTKQKTGAPYHPDNRLVAFGYKSDTCGTENLYFYHNELNYTSQQLQQNKVKLQYVLDNTDMLVGHNVKSDLVWLLECGFNYSGKVWDTMIFEYLMLKGVNYTEEGRLGLSLGECLKRRKLLEKLDTLKKHDDLNTDEIPFAELDKYLTRDIESTYLLFKKQLNIFNTNAEVKSMLPALKLMNETVPLLADMERNGVCIDAVELDRIEEQFSKEFNQLESQLTAMGSKVLGATKFNIKSKDDLSLLIYSRIVKDKHKWAELFNIGYELRNGVKKVKKPYVYSDKEFRDIVTKETTIAHKTEAYQCPTCKGFGKVRKFKKDGTPFKKDNNCKECNGQGYLYKELPTIAGFGVSPISSKYTVQAGFSTDKNVIAELLLQDSLSDSARKFLTALLRYNVINTYLNTYVKSIKEKTLRNILHANYNQCVTATGRLSCTDPNLQNWPRDPAFPVRKAIISRFNGGYILDTDFSQLEFRCAALLSQCEKAIQFVKDGKDIHMVSAEFFNPGKEITKEMRQAAKAETFGPLYGKVTDYTTHFYKAFPGIKKWQYEVLGEQVIQTSQVQSPSGRIYRYNNVTRLRDGRVNPWTQICNYSVQGFATGDIVPVVIIEIWRLMKEHDTKSKLVLTVHDSITADVHPDEQDLMIRIFNQAFERLPQIIFERFGLNCNIPLDHDIAIGYNWGDKEKVAK